MQSQAWTVTRFAGAAPEIDEQRFIWQSPYCARARGLRQRQRVQDFEHNF